MNSLFAGSAIILLPWVLVAGLCLAYAAHSLLTVIEQTAAGFDRVAWPSEHFVDWVGKALYLFGVVVIWSVLAGPLVIAFVVPVLGVGSAEASLLTAAIVLLVFPISLLSSLSASSRLVLLRWEVLKRLGRCWLPVLVFYLTSGIVAVFGAGAALVAVTGLGPMTPALPAPVLVWIDIGVLPGGSLVAAMMLLLYARLLGRLGWIIQAGGRKQHAAAGAEASTEQDGISSPAPPAPAEPLQIGGPDPVVVGAAMPEPYALADDTPAPPTKERPFRWEPGRPPPAAPPRSEWRDLPETPPVSPDERRDRPEPVAPGRLPSLLCPQVIHFPCYRNTIGPWLYLAFGIGLLALLLRLQI